MRESAKCLQKLCKKFPHEDLLWREIDQVMAALKKSHKPNTGTTGRQWGPVGREVFQEKLQYKIMKSYRYRYMTLK